MSIKCILLVIIPLIIVYKFYPDFFNKIVLGLITSILSSGIDPVGEQKSENKVYWSTLYTILLITFIITVVLCVLLKRFNCGLYLFYTWIVTCLIVEVGLSIYISYDPKDIKKKMIELLYDSFYRYSNPEDKIIRMIWDDMQSLLKCCGFRGRDDWNQHKEYLLKNYHSLLPNSCCERQVPCLKGTLYKTLAYTDGCQEKLEIHFEEKTKIVVWAFSGLAVVKVAAVLLSNYYSEQLSKVFQISSNIFANKMNKTRSSKKCQSSTDIPLEKV